MKWVEGKETERTECCLLDGVKVGNPQTLTQDRIHLSLKWCQIYEVAEDELKQQEVPRVDTQRVVDWEGAENLWE